MKDFISDEEMSKLEGTQPSGFISDDDMAKMEQKKPVEGRPIEAAITGFGKGATFGFLDEIQGGLGGLKAGASNVINGEAPSLLDAIKQGYTKSRDEARAYQKQLADENPVADTAGQIASAIPTLFVPGGAAVKLGSMAAQGAIGGFGSAEGNAVEQAKETLKGGVIGGALGGAGKLVGKGISRAGEALNQFKLDSALKSLGAQKAQLNKMGGEFGDDIAQYALDKGLVNPLKSTVKKQQLSDSLRAGVGDELEAVRDKLPQFDKYNVFSKIAEDQKFDPSLLINRDKTRAINIVSDDLEKLSNKTEKINAKDFLDYKANLYKVAKKGFGEENPSKDVLEQARKSMGAIEKKAAGNPKYDKAIEDYAILKKIETLLENKMSQRANSNLGIGGLVGGATSVSALASGNPQYAALGLLGLPKVRSKIGETASLGIDKVQKLTPDFIKKQIQAGRISPEVGAYLIMRQQTSE